MTSEDYELLIRVYETRLDQLARSILHHEGNEYQQTAAVNSLQTMTQVVTLLAMLKELHRGASKPPATDPVPRVRRLDLTDGR